MKNIAAQLKTLKHGKVSPSTEWVKTNRALLLSQIKNTVPAKAPAFALENVWSWMSVFVPRQVVYSVVRPVAVLLIVAMVGSSGAIAAVDASYEALPGDFLYPASRVAQKTQIAVVSLVAGKDAEAKVRAKVVEQLAVKTQKIIKINDEKKTERLTIAVADLKNEINGLSDKLEENKTNPTDPIKADVVKDVKANSDQVKSVLQEVKNDLLISASTTENIALAKEVSVAKDMAKDVSVKAVEVLVTNHVNGGSDTTAEDIKDVLVNAAKITASDAGTSQQNVNDLKAVVDNVKSAAKEAVDKTSTTSIDLATQINSVSNQTVAAVIKSDAAANDATLKASEAEKLAASGDFAKAINKIKEASDASKVVEQISDAAVITVHEVVPVVIVKEEPVIYSPTNTIFVITTTVKIVPTTTLPVAK